MRTLTFLVFLLLARPALADQVAAPPSEAVAAPQVKEAAVDDIREQYWARGKQTSLGVVQNRNHPRGRNFELSATGGILLGDPALSIKTMGATVGFHFSEVFSLHALYFKAQAGPSSALQDLLDRGTAANTNLPRDLLGTEGRFNLTYGKLALSGSEILYLDASLVAGVGRILTETGGSLAVSAGVGQHFHLGKSLSLNLDYRLLMYRETIPGKIPGPSGTLGQTFGPRTNLSHGITLSLSVFFNFASADPSTTSN